MSAATLRAQYPGRCTCGARFEAGACIIWDGSIRRAAVCPACAPPKAKPGPSVTARGITATFYVDAAGAVVACSFTDATDMRALEVYRLRNGAWQCHGGRNPVFSNVLTHAGIEAWRAMLAV